MSSTKKSADVDTLFPSPSNTENIIVSPTKPSVLEIKRLIYSFV